MCCSCIMLWSQVWSPGNDYSAKPEKPYQETLHPFPLYVDPMGKYMKNGR